MSRKAKKTKKSKQEKVSDQKKDPRAESKTPVVVKCDRCGKPVQYFDGRHFSGSVTHIGMWDDGGEVFQNFCFCRECHQEIYSRFEDMLENIHDHGH